MTADRMEITPMHTRLMATTLLALVVALPAWAGYKSQKDEDKAAVRKLELKGAKLGIPKGKVANPTEITTAEQLAKAFPDEQELQAKIKSQVDFTKEKLLYFAWSGSGGDSLSFQVDKGEKGPVVTFMYKRGLTRDVRGHHALYAMPRDATWAMGKKQ
jgi:hypothetical protein